MKKEFSSKWKSSKQPRKQRKYSANAPINVRRKMLTVNLSKDLRKKHGRRNIVVRKGDTVKVMRGKHKKTQAKVNQVSVKKGYVILENVQVKKQDGSMASIKMRPSNLQIVELNLEDNKRKKGLKAPEKKEVKPEEKKKSTEKQGENKK